MKRPIVAFLILLGFLVSLPAQTKNSGTIRGTILDDATGLPLEKVRVTVLCTATPPNKTKPPHRQAATAKDGEFEVTDLPFGPYVVLAGYTSRVKENYVRLSEQAPDQRLTIRVDTSARP